MTRSHFIGWTLVVLLGTAATSSVAQPTAKMEHVTITIDEDGVYPATERVKEGTAIAWLNYSRWKAHIVFPVDVESKISCPKGTDWTKDDKGRLVSETIQNLEYHMPCTFAKGTYHYEVRPENLYIGQPGQGEVNEKIKGTIIVD